MTWLGFLPVVLLAVLLMYVPGAAIAACLKFRLGPVIGMAPLHSTAAAGLAGTIADVLGVPWNIVPYLAICAVLAGLALLMTRGVEWPVAKASWRGLLPYLAVIIAVACVTWRFTQLVGSPVNPAQVFDNVFHLNAVRFILDTGNASSLTLASLQGVSGLDAVYPAAWHSIAALLVQLTGIDIPTAQNALNLVTAAVIWPASCLFLVGSVISRRPAALILVSIVASAQVAFPYLMIVWGPLFPYALAVSMLPAAMTAVFALCGVGRSHSGSRGAGAASLALAIGGLAFAHTSSINTLLAISTPVLLFLWWQRARRLAPWRTPNLRQGLFALTTVFVLGLAAVSWLKLRPAHYDNWGPTVKPGAAIGEILTVSPMQLAIPAVVVSVLSVSGLYVVVRYRKHLLLAACYGAVAALYIVAAAAPTGFIRDAIVGTWYQDTYRLAALLPLFTTPIAVVGGLHLWDLWRRSRAATRTTSALEQRLAIVRGRGQFVAAASVVLVVTVLATFVGPTSHYVSGASTVYRFDAQSEMLTQDERALLARVADHVPPDSVIADNPWNGSSLAYAYAGRRVLTPHLFAGIDPIRELIDKRLKFEPADTEVCDALRHTKVEFVLDFGSAYMLDLAGSNDFPGVTDIGNTAGFELLDSEGPDAKLYRITSCG
ncbi:hypothetical protein AU252_18335 [Pseudarthrobacter sulfonivorans]|uniref:Glycosyltransferase RgtA/B/C/D-like domain-containing protein n=1 Tax=Pseudarthrobacter sulfonivorans TaxID=121292 RepID=A0A0U3FGS0_9MICC|nr:DUF6541 family protein [Pseudarthrobacter sulfonivorans]ALV42873.1 hypothetical protein AU252_18335 [Pseudarthrobacter sulfonivorans]